MDPTPAPRLARLRHEFEASLRPLGEEARPWGVLGFDGKNVGDAALWLGQLAWRRAAGGGEPALLADRKTYRRGRVRARLGSRGLLVLTGGGNLGDVWPAHEAFRRRVLEDFPHTTVVQMPQTIRVARGDAFRRGAEVYARHGDLHLLVRDPESVRLAEEFLGVKARLAPDAAFALGPLRRTGPPTLDVRWFLRTDRESPRWTGSGRAPAPEGIDAEDWPEPGAEFGYRWRRRVAGAMGALGLPTAWRERDYEPYARRRLAQGLAFLSAARHVVTERLHGHVLCLLAGIPHAILGPPGGKLRAFHETWTLCDPLVTVCEDLEAARAWAAARSTADASPSRAS